MSLCFSRHSSPPASSQSGASGGCAFCKRNRESVQMYSSHQVKDQLGRVTCPMLRKYVCGGCGATGDNAHTRSYCPNVVSARLQREHQQQQKRREQASQQQEAHQHPQHPLQQQPHLRQSTWSNMAAAPSSFGSLPMPPPVPVAVRAAASSQPLGQQQQQQQQPEADIQLGSNRAFNNMSKVTNSLYNSAGRLRNRHPRRPPAQQQQQLTANIGLEQRAHLWHR